MTIFSKANYRWVILLACTLAYITSQIVRWNYASITQYLTVDLKIGKPELGVLGSAFFYAYAVAQIPWGTAHDVWGARKTIPLGIAALSIFLAGFAFTSTFTEAIAWRAGMGFMAAAAFVPNNALLSKWFTVKERAFALGANSALGGALGEVIVFLLVPLIALILGDGGTFMGLSSWRGSTFLMGMVVLAISVACFALMRSDPSDIGLESIQKAEDLHDATKTNYREVVFASLKDPGLWLISISWSGFIMACRLFPGWMPMYGASYYMQTKGMSKAGAAVAAGVILSCYIAGRLIGTTIVAKLCDYMLKRYGTPRSVFTLAMLIGCFLVFYAFTFQMASEIILGILAFLAGTFCNAYSSINAACAEIWSIRTAGFNNGIVNTVGQLTGATALAMSGYWAVKYADKAGGYASEFAGVWYLGMIISAIAALCALYVLYVEKKAMQKHKQAITCETSRTENVACDQKSDQSS